MHPDQYLDKDVYDKLPKHLLQYINQQHYDRYTPIDQAVWRYVMKKNIQHLPEVAHSSYLKGLQQAGISTEEIPSMYGMNRILKNIGWSAVAVDGFIPSNAFLEFQAYNVLVIAHEIRKVEHISYTPAPDIIHESAGHAPIIANPEYAEYLRRMGEIGAKAISSIAETKLYEAIRMLSILKESRTSKSEEIVKAEELVDSLQSKMDTPSEMTHIKNLHWWTVEYGLIGDLTNPKIYGAGLLSSIGESKSCLSDDVLKLPYTIEAVHHSFDITKPQPQLFVTPDFAHLSYVLEEYANTMSVRKGGLEGIKRLIASEQLGTIHYNTGIQVSGVFTDVIADGFGNPIYFNISGPAALAYQQKELIGHSTKNHVSGFGSPIGKLKNVNLPIESMSPFDLSAYKIKEGEHIKLSFEGGVIVEGEVITGKRNLQGVIIMISFINCLVTYKDRVLHKPNQGIYHMAVGSYISSAFAGAADVDSFRICDHILSNDENVKPKSNDELVLESLYQEVRDMRNQEEPSVIRLDQIEKQLKTNYPKDWLLSHEIQEIMTSCLSTTN
jgi:phenylalanine-4-hydroxylase